MLCGMVLGAIRSNVSRPPPITTGAAALVLVLAYELVKPIK